MDAERDHAKSELEQIKVDITSAMKQKGSLEKALGKKVLCFVFFLNCSWRILITPVAIMCAL
jgi:hypothetical protein